MAILTRLSRLFQADFHGILDRIEEPDLQLKQAVREMQFALDHDKQRLEYLQHENEQLEKVTVTTTNAIKEFNQELDICIAEEKDELARDLIRRKLIANKQIQLIEHKKETLTKTIQTLTHQVGEQSQQVEAMKQKLAILVSEESQFDPTNLHQHESIRQEEIEIALLKEKQLRG